MGLGALNTILNTAPLIIQGATKLIRIIKDRENSSNDKEDIPSTLDGMNNEISRIHTRLDANDQSNVEQIKLIEKLAKQNEALASSLKKSITQLNIISLIAVIAFTGSLAMVLLIIAR